MKILIAKTEFFEINVDKELNRLYLLNEGMWKSADALRIYVIEIKDSLSYMGANFSVLLDNSKLLPMSQEVQRKIIFPVTAMIQQAGVGKTAVILPEEDVAEIMVELNVSRLKKNDKEINSFSTIDEAEFWLDHEIEI
ncbi:hypothetical protein [Flexithrix dorotheae]|uniref:hypothetical protein n=1 Tax=Flexithrix dorotheae TaxID=70993 RepID=UPI00036668AC|nr:hypothetical protein [Flexithrix dorotheae]